MSHLTKIPSLLTYGRVARPHVSTATRTEITHHHEGGLNRPPKENGTLKTQQPNWKRSKITGVLLRCKSSRCHQTPPYCWLPAHAAKKERERARVGCCRLFVDGRHAAHQARQVNPRRDRCYRVCVAPGCRLPASATATCLVLFLSCLPAYLSASWRALHPRHSSALHNPTPCRANCCPSHCV